MNYRIEKFLPPFLRGRRLAMGLFLALFAIAAITLLIVHPSLGIAAFAFLPMCGVVMGEDEFQTKVLGGVERLAKDSEKFRSQIDTVLADTSRLDREAKIAAEELTRAKNQMNATFEDVMKRMERVQRQVALNARSSFRNPIQRALENEEFSFALNAIARYLAAARADSTGTLDPAFKKFIEDSRLKAKALTGVDSGLGQATVPIETFNQIYDLLLEYGDFATLGVERVGARTVVYPVATARPQFAWIGAQSTLAESSTIPSGSFAGGQVMLIVQTLAVLMYVARELLADSTVDLAPYVIQQMIQSVNWGMDTAAFISTGSQDTVNAGYVGIFNAPLANSNLASVAGPGHTYVSSLALNDFVQTILTVSPEVLNRKPKWWTHSQQLARISLIRDQMGRPLFQTFIEVPNPGSVGSILGYPVHPTAIAPTTDGPNNPVLAFGDPQGQVIGIRSDLELATSADIGFPQNLMAYRTLMRAGVKMKTQPASTTLKPFAVLTTAAS